MERQAGKAPEKLAEARDNPCPEALRYLWELYCEVASRRQFGEGRPLAISNSELRAWLALRGVLLEPWEVRVLDELEQAFMAHAGAAKVAK